MAKRLAGYLQRGMRPPNSWDDPICWRRRTWNKQADWLVNRVMDTEQDIMWCDNDITSAVKASNVVIFSDGGYRKRQNTAAAGWALYIVQQNVARLVAYQG
eukprot:10678624-Karenia_brevis.AAC.1